MGKFQLFPVQASTLAPEVDHLLYFLLAVTVFFTLLIFGAIFYFAIKYRRRSENELPHVQHTGYTLEILWSVIPFGITMVMFTWGASIFFTASKPPNNAIQIYACLLYTSDAADDLTRVDLGGRRIIKKKKK